MADNRVADITAVEAERIPRTKNSDAAAWKITDLLAPIACRIAASFFRWSVLEKMEAIKARMPAAKARIKIYCTASEALEIVLCTCLIIEPISTFVMVGKRLTKSLMILLS